MLLTKKHKTLQHKKLSWTSQNLSKKNYFLPRPTPVSMPLWMRWKENRTSWDWIKSKGYNPYWLAKNQTLLVISQSSWQQSNSPHEGTYKVNGEEQLSRSFQGAFTLKQQLPDLSCRAVLGFRPVICSTFTHACTHLPPDICIQLKKAVVGREVMAVNITSACRGCPSHHSPRAVSLQGWCQPICQEVRRPLQKTSSSSVIGRQNFFPLV